LSTAFPVPWACSYYTAFVYGIIHSGNILKAPLSEMQVLCQVQSTSTTQPVFNDIAINSVGDSASSETIQVV
jgi:hypothetical protein